MLSPFVNYFTNYLYLNPTSLLRPEGQVYEYQQTVAMLTGGEASIDCSHFKYLNLKAGMEYVYAVNLELKRAVPFTPPLSIQTEINYLFKSTELLSKSQIGIEAIWFSEQIYTVPNELTTPGSILFDLNAKTDVKVGKQKITIMLKVRNMLDSKYYNHISFYRRLRIPEPGRDIQLFINIPI